jgi:lysophospholipase L1-like esterase
MGSDYASTVEAADPYCLRDGEAAGLLAAHRWRRFVVLGDSIAEGVGEPMHGYHPLPLADRVNVELRHANPHLCYHNLGRRNLRTADVRAEQLAAALAFEPDLALVVCGANDAMRPGYERRADAVDADLTAIVTALRRRGADVITMSIFVMPTYAGVPRWLAPDFIRRMAMLGRHTTAVATALDTIHVDLAAHPAIAEAPLTCSDGLHGNGRSQAIAAAETIRRLGTHIAAVTSVRS